MQESMGSVFGISLITFYLSVPAGNTSKKLNAATASKKNIPLPTLPEKKNLRHNGDSQMITFKTFFRIPPNLRSLDFRYSARQNRAPRET